MNIPTWSAIAAYAIDDVVVRVVNGVARLWRAIRVIASVGNDNPTVATSSWNALTANAWDGTAGYNVGDYAVYNGTLYRAIQVTHATSVQIATWNVGSHTTSGSGFYNSFNNRLFVNSTALTGSTPSATSQLMHTLSLTGNSSFPDATATGGMEVIGGGTTSIIIGGESNMQAAFGSSTINSGGGVWTLARGGFAPNPNPADDTENWQAQTTPAWDGASAYATNDIVNFNNAYYQASATIAAVTPNTSPESDSVNWEELSPGAAPTNPSLKNWSVNASYAQFDIVEFNGRVYRAINAISSTGGETTIATWNVNTGANPQTAQFNANNDFFVYNGNPLTGNAPTGNNAAVHNLELTGNSIRTGTNTATGAIVNYSSGFLATHNFQIGSASIMETAFGDTTIASGGGQWRLYTGSANADPENDTTNWEEVSATQVPTAEQVRDILTTLQGSNRLPASAIRDLPNNYKGMYQNSTAYSEGNIVEHSGELYAAAQDIPASNTTPPSTTNAQWIHLSSEDGGSGYTTGAQVRDALQALSNDNRLDVSAVKGVITPSAGTGINVSNTGAISLDTIGAARELSELRGANRISAAGIEGLQFQTASSIVAALEALTGNDKLSYNALNSATQPPANSVIINPVAVTDLNLFLPPNNEVHFAVTTRSPNNAPNNVTEPSFVIVAKLNNGAATQQITDSETDTVFVRQYANGSWQGWTQTGGADGDLINATFANSQLTFTRRSGQNPIELALPTIVQNTNPYQFFYQVKDIATPAGAFAILSSGDGLDLPFLAKVTPDANTAGVAIVNRNFETSPEGFINVAVSGSGVARLDISLKTTHHFNEINSAIPDLVTDERVESFEVVLGVATPVALRAFGSDVVLTSSSTGSALAGMAIPISMVVNIKAFNSAGVRVSAVVDSINYNKCGITFKQLANNSGAKGDKGDAGDSAGGIAFDSVTGTPPANDGRPDGAVVFNTSNNTFYEKVSGAYVARYTITASGGSGTWQGEFVANRAYAFGAIVANDNNLWIARTAIPVDNTTPPAVGNSWWRITNLSQTAVSSDEYGSANNATMFVTIISQIDAAVVKLVASPNQTINIDGNSYTRHDIDKLMRMRKSYQRLLSNAIARSGNTRARKAKVKG